MPTLTQIFKSKTLTFGFLLMVASVAQIVVPFLPLEPRMLGAVGAFIASAVIVLRFLTTLPVSEK